MHSHDFFKISLKYGKCCSFLKASVSALIKDLLQWRSLKQTPQQRTDDSESWGVWSSQGADCNSTCILEQTPLFEAARDGYINAVRTFVEEGDVALNLRESVCRTALDWATNQVAGGTDSYYLNDVRSVELEQRQLSSIGRNEGAKNQICLMGLCVKWLLDLPIYRWTQHNRMNKGEKSSFPTCCAMISFFLSYMFRLHNVAFLRELHNLRIYAACYATSQTLYSKFQRGGLVTVSGLNFSGWFEQPGPN
jgi:hypothetical protein